MHEKLRLFFVVMLFAFASLGQTPDTTMKRSPVRTLTDQQYNAYLKGTDLGNKMAYVAELNHYPLPDKLLQYKKELDLSPSQITQITAILKTLKMKRLEIGESVIRNERMLDSLFRTHKLDDGIIIFYGNRYGLYEGEYRTALLTACYKTQKLLTDRQIKLFEALQKHN